jgi:O-glycosyl hydrolase
MLIVLNGSIHVHRCLDEYKKNGVEFWGLTPQNEPFHGVELYHGFNSLGWTAEEQRDWLANFFGPALNSSGYGGLKVMTLDDSRIFLPQWAEVVSSQTFYTEDEKQFLRCYSRFMSITGKSCFT